MHRSGPLANAFPMTVLAINVFLVLGFGAVAIVAGTAVHARSTLLRRCLIPPPIIAGLILAVPTLLLRRLNFQLDVDPTVQQIAMVALFTSIGFSLDKEGLRRGGRPVLVFLAMVGLGALVQNLVGIGMAWAMGLHPVLGIATGAVSLTGGPATSLAFGPVMEEAGAKGATSMALASALCSILVAGLLTGAFGGFLIRRDGLKPMPDAGWAAEPAAIERAFHPTDLLRTLLPFGFAMGLGQILNSQFNEQFRSVSISLPAFVGAMLVACVMKLLSGRYNILKISPLWNDAFGTAALMWFIPLALWTLRYWELADLAPSIPVILAVQFPVTVIISWIAYRLAGRSYDSAVMASGYFGFMFGTMANSLAAMNELRDRFGESRQAYLVIPIIGGVLADSVNIAIISVSIFLVRH
jgi:ESS family glutamate:Na+ symporter